MSTDDNVLLGCLDSLLHRELMLSRNPEGLEAAISMLRDGIEQLRALPPIQVEPVLLPPNEAQSMFPAAFDMSALVDDSFLPQATAMLVSYDGAAVPPELYEPLPSTIADRVFPSFVGFDDSAAYRACVLCGTSVDPSVVSTMSLPGAESLGSINVCTCVFGSAWPEMERPFDETGRPTAMGLLSS